MDIQRLNALVREFPPETAATVREFAQREQDEQLVYLFMELQDAKSHATAAVAAVKELQRKKTPGEQLAEWGPLGALILYALVDNKGHLPSFLTGGK